MAARLDIALQRNEDWAATLTLTRTDKTPIDLNGVTLAMQVRDRLTQDLIESADIAVIDAAAGLIKVVLQASEGTPLASYGVPIQSAALPYDLRMTVNDVNIILISGQVLLRRGETIA